MMKIDKKCDAIDGTLTILTTFFTRGFFETNEDVEVVIKDVNITKDNTFEAKAVGYACAQRLYAATTVGGSLVRKGGGWSVPFDSLNVRYGVGSDMTCEQTPVRYDVLPDGRMKFWWKAVGDLPEILIWETPCPFAD